MGVLDAKAPREAVLSARAVHIEHFGSREAGSGENLDTGWRCGRERRLRRTVIAGFAVLGWSMVCFSSDLRTWIQLPESRREIMS